MIGNRQAISITTAALCGWLMASSAQALPKAPQGGDYFGRVTNPNPTTSVNINPSPTRSGLGAVQWFEAFDDVIASHQPSAGDRALMKRPFNQEAERVQQWSDTAAKIAKNYRHLVSMLKAMPVPAGLTGVKEYRDLTIDWYSDAASIYEDLIRPRRPARTIEELQATLNEIKTRSEGLAQENSNLKETDIALRSTFHVHAARQTDSLQQYVRAKLQ